ncbi:hypothetical protein BC829DRAFT_409299 [Chytridium lagenaria]|nr:hypothetical protein BC829DRAFT_409299 [Chytridium lagenaria]
MTPIAAAAAARSKLLLGSILQAAARTHAASATTASTLLTSSSVAQGAAASCIDLTCISTSSANTISPSSLPLNGLTSSPHSTSTTFSTSSTIRSLGCTIQTRHIRIKSSNPDSTSTTSASSASSSAPPKPPIGEQPKSSAEDDARASEGMDLFSRALKAQRARQAAESEAAKGASSSTASSEPAANANDAYGAFRGPSDDGSDQPLSPEEEERLRRLRERAEAEESKTVAKRGRMILGVAGGALAMAYAYMGLPGKDENFGGLGQHNKRAMSYLTGGYKLLPDPLPEAWQQRNTLFIELNDTLVHMTWDKSLGWRAALRPGVKKFLAYLSRYYEVVVFTTSHNYLAAPVLESLDPFGYYKRYALFRDSTRLVKGKYVKDLAITNRDLANCIIVDPDSMNYQLQPENGVPIKPWKLEKNDRELEKMMTFLEEVAWMREVLGNPDIRTILDQCRKFDENPVIGWEVYKTKLSETFTAKYGEQAQQAAKSQTSSNVIANLISSTTSALFGRGLKSVVSTQNPSGVHPGDIVGAIQMYSRLEREAFEKEYAEKMKEMEELKKLQEQDIARQVQEMKDKKLTLKDYMAGGMQPPGSAEAPK